MRNAPKKLTSLCWKPLTTVAGTAVVLVAVAAAVLVEVAVARAVLVEVAVARAAAGSPSTHQSNPAKHRRPQTTQSTGRWAADTGAVQCTCTAQQVAPAARAAAVVEAVLMGIAVAETAVGSPSSNPSKRRHRPTC